MTCCRNLHLHQEGQRSEIHPDLPGHKMQMACPLSVASLQSKTLLLYSNNSNPVEILNFSPGTSYVIYLLEVNGISKTQLK